mgnify:FL=1
MAETNKVIELDPKDYKLNDYDNVRITMPAKPALSEEDVDAQLFEYVLSGGKHINSIADLDDAWVQSNFEGMSTIEEVRQAIKDQYDHDLEFEYSDIKYKLCADALIARLEGDVPEETLTHNVDAMRAGNLARLEAMHISFEQFLREEHMTPDQYEDKLRNETLYQMRLNVALDIMADVLNMQVGNHELTEYLSAPDPEKFLAEIREKNMVEEARRAAVRVKVMRRVIDTAIVTEEGAPEKPAEVKPAPVDDDEEMPDLGKMPLPQIRDDHPDEFRIVEKL